MEREQSAGFSTAPQLKRRPVQSGQYSYKNANVEKERKWEDSILKECTALARIRSDYAPLSYQNRTLAAQGLVMVVTYRDEACVPTVLFNFSSHEWEIEGVGRSLTKIHSAGLYDDRSKISGHGHR